MSRRLDVDDSDQDAVNAMAVEMVDVLNLSTQAAWSALMGDRTGLLKVMDQLRGTIEKLLSENAHLSDG